MDFYGYLVNASLYFEELLLSDVPLLKAYIQARDVFIIDVSKELGFSRVNHSIEDNQIHIPVSTAVTIIVKVDLNEDYLFENVLPAMLVFQAPHNLGVHDSIDKIRDISPKIHDFFWEYAQRT